MEKEQLLNKLYEEIYECLYSLENIFKVTKNGFSENSRVLLKKSLFLCVSLNETSDKFIEDIGYLLMSFNLYAKNFRKAIGSFCILKEIQSISIYLKQLINLIMENKKKPGEYFQYTEIIRKYINIIKKFEYMFHNHKYNIMKSILKYKNKTEKLAIKIFSNNIIEYSKNGKYDDIQKEIQISHLFLLVKNSFYKIYEYLFYIRKSYFYNFI